MALYCIILLSKKQRGTLPSFSCSLLLFFFFCCCWFFILFLFSLFRFVSFFSFFFLNNLFRDWRVAEKHFSKGNSDKGKKIIVHATKLAAMALQIATLGEIKDYTCCAKYAIAMQNDTSEDWNHYHALFRPIFDRYIEKLKEACSGKKRG